MKEVDTKKWLLKVVSLLLAVLLWVYVGIEKNPFEERSFQVPVTMTHLADELSAEMSVKYVNITVRGRETRLRNISARDFTANVDLSQVKTGDNSCEVNVRAPSGVYVSKVSPNEINVSVEHAAGAHFDVQLEKVGELPSGETLKDIKIEPKSVFVSGEQTAINTVDKVQVQLDLSQIQESGTVELPLEMIGKKGQSLDKGLLEMRSKTAKVSYVLEKNQEDKMVSVTPVFQDGANGDVQVSAIRPAKIHIKGDKKTLEKVTSISTEPIDVRSINAEKTVQVKLKVPNGVQVDTDQVEVVLIPKGNSTSTTRVDLPIQIKGSSTGSVVLNQKSVAVEYQGNQAAVSGLSAYIDVSGMPAGTHQVTVNIARNGNVKVLSVTPTTIQVTISGEGTNDQTNNGQGSSKN